jgi:hypothetical protein
VKVNPIGFQLVKGGVLVLEVAASHRWWFLAFLGCRGWLSLTACGYGLVFGSDYGGLYVQLGTRDRLRFLSHHFPPCGRQTKPKGDLGKKKYQGKRY